MGGKPFAMPAATDPETGMVTAELAVGIGVLLALLVALTQLLQVLLLAGRCADAARAGARLAARGEGDAAITTTVERALPGATVVLGRSGAVVGVTVTAAPHLLPGSGWLLPSGRVMSRAVADSEPDNAGSS